MLKDLSKLIFTVFICIVATATFAQPFQIKQVHSTIGVNIPIYTEPLLVNTVASNNATFIEYSNVSCNYNTGNINKEEQNIIWQITQPLENEFLQIKMSYQVINIGNISIVSNNLLLRSIAISSNGSEALNVNNIARNT